MSAHYEKSHGFNIQQADFVCRTYLTYGEYVGIIYSYTNLHNGKRYVGQTLSPLSRHESHERAGKYCAKEHTSPFHKALKKYSSLMFVYEVLEFIYADTRREYQALADERERFWIKEFNATDSKCGYNATHGGQFKKDNVSKVQTKAVDKYTLWGEYVASYDNQKSAAASVGLRAITRAFTEPDRHHQCGGFLWTRKGDPVHQSDIDYYKHFLIYQYDLDGNYIQSFFKIKSVWAYIKKDLQFDVSYDVINATIAKAVDHPQTRSAYGFKWFNEKHDKLPFDVGEGSRIKISEYDLSLRLVAVHRSISECSRNTGVSFHCIKKQCDEKSPIPVKNRLFRYYKKSSHE